MDNCTFIGSANDDDWVQWPLGRQGKAGQSTMADPEALSFEGGQLSERSESERHLCRRKVQSAVSRSSRASSTG